MNSEEFCINFRLPVIGIGFALIFLFFFCGKTKLKANDNDYTQKRKRMVKEQIAARGVTDQRVLKAMEKVPRHWFVPEPLRVDAYGDFPLPIGEGQTISQPYIVARMTELLQLKGDEKVLEIGTGSGYQAAVLALLTKEVYTIEIIENLAKAAKERLQDLGYNNVKVKFGDGYLGWTEYAPFDAIIITCAPPFLPDSLVRQLKDGGRIVAPMGEENQTQILTVFQKQGEKLLKTEYEPVRFVPMTGKIEEKK
ncbi:MAG: protein-L-isoaspartate(D-aspartate) O-methyltransferase [candidate division WOR-3 bacterium]